MEATFAIGESFADIDGIVDHFSAVMFPWGKTTEQWRDMVSDRHQ